MAVETQFHLRLATLITLTTAARVTAVLELTWSRVDLERGQINLRTGEGGRKGRAIVPINDTLFAAPREARAGALSGHVIEWADQPVKRINKGFAAMVKKAGLEDVSPHVLRHRAAVLMAGNGTPMSELSQYLGHSNIQTTADI